MECEEAAVIYDARRARQGELVVGLAGALPVDNGQCGRSRRRSGRRSSPALGVDDRFGGDAGGHERAERVARGRAEPASAAFRAGAADLDGDADERLGVALAPTAQCRVSPAEEAFIDA